MIKVFVGKAGSGKTYNIKKDIRQQIKKNPSSKIGIVTPFVKEYDDLEDIRENLKFADTSKGDEVILSEFIGRNTKDSIDVFVIDNIDERNVFPSFLSFLVRYSEIVDIIISTQTPSELLFEMADVIYFCDRARENSIRKAERLELKAKELGV